jgi:hypothetical protein
LSFADEVGCKVIFSLICSGCAVICWYSSISVDTLRFHHDLGFKSFMETPRIIIWYENRQRMLPTGSRILPDVSFLTAIWTEILPFQDILFYLQQQVSNQWRLDRFFTSLSDLSWVSYVSQKAFVHEHWVFVHIFLFE